MKLDFDPVLGLNPIILYTILESKPQRFSIFVTHRMKYRLYNDSVSSEFNFCRTLIQLRILQNFSYYPQSYLLMMRFFHIFGCQISQKKNASPSTENVSHLIYICQSLHFIRGTEVGNSRKESTVAFSFSVRLHMSIFVFTDVDGRI